MSGLREHKMEQILDVMKDGDVVTAEIMARRAGCSERTVYRYVQMLRAEGHTILSEAGYGYLLKQRPPATEGGANG